MINSTQGTRGQVHCPKNIIYIPFRDRPSRVYNVSCCVACQGLRLRGHLQRLAFYDGAELAFQ